MITSRNFILLATLIPFCCFAEKNEYEWELQKSKVYISQSVTIDDKYLVQTFFLDYLDNRECKESASILSVANSKKLGNYKSKDVSSSNKDGNKLRFMVDGKEVKYSQEKIIRVIYDNGVEFGTIAPPELATTLSGSKGNLEVFLGDMKMIKIINSIGFTEKNKIAYEYCLKNKK